MKFSIIIPTYKGVDTLPIAIQSVIRQTFSDYEIIVSDDNYIGSKEQIETENIVKKIENKGINIKYLINDHHNGSYARNKGIEIASGNYITLLDDDDFYCEDYLNIANMNIEKNKDIHLLFFDVISINKENFAKKVSCPDINSRNLLFGISEIGTGSNICFINDKIHKNYFDERYIRHQDIEFVCKLMNKYNYKWIQEIEIVKYFNGNDNYPNIDKALKMQELLRNDMLSLHIINSSEEIELKNKQLHSLFNDLLVKNVPYDEINKVVYVLKSNGIFSFKDKLISFIYRISKTLFNSIISIYFKNKQSSVKSELINQLLDYRNKLDKD